MIQKRDVFRYLLIGAIILLLIVFLLVLRGNFTGKIVGYGITGFAVFENSGSEFDNGTYTNTTYNGSAVVLVGNNLTGVYTSQIFDAGSTAQWNNLTKNESNPFIDFLFSADNSADVWVSNDSGATWSLVKDDYNGGDNNGVTDMAKNSSGSLFILFNQNIWKSDDKGVTWTKVNDNYNGAEGQDGFVLGIDKNNNLIIVEGGQDVWKSTDSGTSFTKVSDDFNGGNGNVFGIAVNSSDVVFVVDNQADVWKSNDSGATWSSVKDDYNGANSNGATDMTINSSDSLFILDVQDVWKSTDSGVTWSLVNDDFNGADTNNGIVIYSDENNYIYIIDGSKDVFKSTDSGASFSLLASNFNDANGNVFGITSLRYYSNLSFQVRNCSQSDCSDGNWQTANLNNLNLIGRYFQYRVIFRTEDSSITPELNSVSVDYTILNTPPSISIISPQNGATYGYNESINLNFTVSDSEGNINSCWYNINNGDNLTISNCQNTTFDVSGNSNYFLNIYVNDTNGEQSSDSVSFTIQIGAPTITLHCPINTYLNYNNIQFNYTPSDVDLSSCELWGDFIGVYQLNQTDNSPTSGQINHFSLNLTDNSYLWNIKCNDNLGNSATNGNQTFYIDTINPQIILTEPTGKKTSRTITASWTSSDASPTSCLYNVYRGENIEIANTSVNCSANSASFDVTVDASFIFNFYINDSAGNSNRTNSSFSVDTSSPSQPPSGGDGGGGGGAIIQTNTTGKIEMSKIEEIIVQPGDKKTLSINVKNTGKIFLNNCKLTATGDISSWIYSNQIQGLSPGENSIFIFNLNIPEGIKGEYSGEIEVKCDEIKTSQKIKISTPKTIGLIQIKEIKQEKHGLNVTYIFNPRFAEDKISVEIWITDEEENEIQRYTDTFSVDKELIERNILIKLPQDLIGIYYIYFAMSSDESEFVKQSIVLGKSLTAGQTILGTTGKKLAGYIVFILMIIAVVFIAFRNYFMRKINRLKSKKRKNARK